MLDSVTKRRIDTARDILVGKIPDPKSQVEQITIALIYKFMDDMDTESEQEGGKRRFFTGDLEKYAWSKLVSASTGGHQKLHLYGEAIEKFQTSPNLPQLFRDIFKNAFLPYRDPETLNLFLKTINEFTYEHSERLGDAFEYLLSVLGSQGDAGQFRTPRYIIDFIVECVDPQKNDRILDPACGTAGFLISAYKYILRQNAKDGKDGAALTPDERARLLDNMVGYDISPDMVRLSRANMYLHGFPTPHIQEYDTLTSEDKWGEYYDVILANPPFMTPKGGIMPHRRFAVQANRSEVLFVDYITEHLLQNGRAGVIVPEGIIFQGGNAYKALRKMLLDKALYAVVSLPSGVFLPYSGVKTSILLLDKSLSKQTNQILFIDIKDTGVSLGATQAPIAKNDLPLALTTIKEFKEGRSVKPNDSIFTVYKSIIAQFDYIFSLSRYRQVLIQSNIYPLVALSTVCNILKGKSSSTKTEPGDYRLVLTAETAKTANNYDFEGQGACIPLISSKGHGKAAIKRVHFVQGKFALADLLAFVEPKDKNTIDPKYVFLCLEYSKDDIAQLMKGAANVSMKVEDLAEYKIPLPPLPIQQELVAEIEGYQKIIDGARQVVENYKPQIKLDPSWPMVELETTCDINPKKSSLGDISPETIVSFVPMADLNVNELSFTARETRQLKDVMGSYTYFEDNDVIIARVTPCFENGKAGLASGLENGIGFGSSEFTVLRAGNKVLPKWLYYIMATPNFRQYATIKMTGTGGLQRVPKDVFSSFLIPVPPLEEQSLIITQIDLERTMVDVNKNLIGIFEQKIKNIIAEVWHG